MNDTALQEVVDLGPRGRLVRVLVTLVAAALLLAGTLVGTDDDFPFGPFKMYASTDNLNAPVRDTRVEATDQTGRHWVLSDAQTGIRRAEIEGQLGSFTADPARLVVVADAYRHRNPGTPALTEVDIVIRWRELRNGRPTGAYRDETKAVWRP